MRNLIKELNNLKEAFNSTRTAWEKDECDDVGTVPSYPFEDDFDEITLRVNDWVKDFTEHIEAEIKEQEEIIPVTYALIKLTVGWSRFAEVTGRNVYAVTEHGHYQDHEIFRITEKQAKKLKFI